MADIFVSGSEVPKDSLVIFDGPPVAASRTSEASVPTDDSGLQVTLETSRSYIVVSLSPTGNSGDSNSAGKSPAPPTPSGTYPPIPMTSLLSISSTTEDTIATPSTTQDSPSLISDTTPIEITATSMQISALPPSSMTESNAVFPPFEPTQSQGLPQQPSTSVLTGEGMIHSFPVKLVVAAVVPSVIILIIGMIMFFLWRRKRAKRKEQEDRLEGTAVWYNRHGTDDHRSRSSSGEQDVGSPIGTAIDSRSSALILPKSTTRDLESTPANGRQSCIEQSENNVNPFIPPRSQISFPERLATSASPPGSPTEYEVSTDADCDHLVVSAGSSIETVIHHTSHRVSDPFTDRAATNGHLREQEGEHRSFGVVSGNQKLLRTYSNDSNASQSDENLDRQDYALQSDSTKQHLSTITEQSHSSNSEVQSHNSSCLSFNTAQGANAGALPAREESDLDLARKLIRGLKKEAFEAQKAAAAAEQQASALKNAE